MTDPNFPDRPEHPDFWGLSEIITTMDDTADTKGPHIVWQEDGVDITSLTYMARQRALRAKNLLVGATEKEKLTIMWLDAFTAGLRFARKQAQPTITIDDSQHRTGASSE